MFGNRLMRRVRRIGWPARSQSGYPIGEAATAGVSADVAALQAALTAAQADIADIEAAIADLLGGDGLIKVDTGVVSHEALPTNLANGQNFTLDWTSVAHADLTFAAQTGTWTVDSGDLSYFKYARIGTVLLVKCAIVTSSVSATPTELRVGLGNIPLTLQGNDSFGFSVFSEDGFATQDVGQAILRVSNNSLVFKPRTGGTWLTTANQTAVITLIQGEVQLP